MRGQLIDLLEIPKEKKKKEKRKKEKKKEKGVSVLNVIKESRKVQFFIAVEVLLTIILFYFFF